MPELDITRAPRGVLAAQALVTAVAEQGDLAERHYLELKSTLDLSTKKDKEKIAKFILGAANRMPNVAATAFEGYGVMIIGVAQDAITGIPPVEMMEISKVIQKYVGAAGPRWDIVWVPVEGTANQVLVIIVDSPKLGQGPFPCRASGDSLTDGRIYIRADGETREANSAEFDLLVQRGSAGAQVEVDFAVEVLGEVASVTVDEKSTVDEYVDRVCASLVAALPEKKPSTPTIASRRAGLTGMSGHCASALNESSSSVAKALIEPENRSEKEYLESIDQWKDRFRAAWTAALPKIAVRQLHPVTIRITNRTKTFFHNVEMNLHLEGDVFAFDYSGPEWADDSSDLKLPHPPREWGPTQRSLDIPNYASMDHPYYLLRGLRASDPPNRVKLCVRELRPLGTYKSEDIVLVVADRSLTSIRGTWELTARDHNDVYTGKINVDVAENHDLTAAARKILALNEEATE